MICLSHHSASEHHTHNDFLANKRARTHARTRARAHARTHARAHARTHACMHAHTHAHTHARTHARTRTRMHTSHLHNYRGQIKIVFEIQMTEIWTQGRYRHDLKSQRCCEGVIAVIYYIFQTVFHQKTDWVFPQSLPPSQAARSSKRCAAADNNYHLSKHFVFSAPITGSQASSLCAKAFLLHSFLPFFLFPAALSSIIIVLCGAPHRNLVSKLRR